MTMYDESPSPGITDLIKVTCSEPKCDKTTKRFCQTCHKWYCREHIQRHVCHVTAKQKEIKK
jgi:hypothetical protein